MKLLVPLALLLAACASTGPSPSDDAPLPYTADQIRDAHPPGTIVVFRVEAAGQPAVVQRMVFHAGPAPGSTSYETSTTTTAGEPVGEPATANATWRELRDHARFPAAGTTRVDAAVDVGAGHFDCWLYTVAGEDQRGATTTRYWFAKSKPGPPVRLEVERAGDVELAMEMVEYRRP